MYAGEYAIDTLKEKRTRLQDKIEDMATDKRLIETHGEDNVRRTMNTIKRRIKHLDYGIGVLREDTLRGS